MLTKYSWEYLRKDMDRLRQHSLARPLTIGKSVLGRSIFCVEIGSGHKRIFINGAHHALEWLTSMTLVLFAQYLVEMRPAILKSNTFCIAPMVNPDGVELATNGLTADNPFYNALIRQNNYNLDFSQTWQANIRGVDLNHNYDAMWEKSKKTEPEYGIFGPGPTRYGGEYPESEPETRAVANYTRKMDFDMVLAYHSQGEVIYWDYMGMASERSKHIARRLARASGYEMDETEGIASYAGYKDWFIKEYGRPGYTIEIGKGKNPLPVTQLDSILRKNLRLLLMAAVLV